MGTTRKAVLARKCLAYGTHLNALGMPGEHFFPEELDRGDILRILARGLAALGQRRIVGHLIHRIEPASLSGNAPNIGNCIAPHPLGSGTLRFVSPNRSR
jgi:hypothetical protein